MIAKRNANLAEALGISPDSLKDKGSSVVYPDELVSFFRYNTAFCAQVERALSE